MSSKRHKFRLFIGYFTVVLVNSKIFREIFRYKLWYDSKPIFPGLLKNNSNLIPWTTSTNAGLRWLFNEIQIDKYGLEVPCSSSMRPTYGSRTFVRICFTSCTAISRIALYLKYVELDVVQIQSYMTAKQIYPMFQSAYRQHHSTKTVLFKYFKVKTSMH